MRIAYLECFSGVSGDMFVGALLDAGVPPELLTRTVEALGVDARLEISRVDRSGISATKLDVIAAGETEPPRAELWRPDPTAAPQSPSHEHEHDPTHTLSHAHALGDDQSHPPGESHSLSLSHGDGRGHSHELSGSPSHSHRGL